MAHGGLADGVVRTWKINNRINLNLVRRIPTKGFEAVPLGSKGRNVAQVFAHMHRVRLGWLSYNGRESIAGLPRFAKGSSAQRSELVRAHFGHLGVPLNAC